MAISIPVGVLSAIYISESKNSRFKEIIRLFGDTFVGTPSIVTGVFIYTLLVLKFGFSAFAGALALIILAVPMILRTSEDAIKTFLVSRYLERIGDIIEKNGARVIFIKEGRKVWVK
jgi:ABC-type phosphate transport system permease subunit